MSLSGMCSDDGACVCGQWMTRDGLTVQIRSIQPDDEERMVRFHAGLSERSVYLRYFNAFKLESRTAHERLARICCTDPLRETVLVAEATTADGQREILAVARLVGPRGAPSAEFAIVVADAWQGRGLGTELLSRLVALGQYRGLRRIVGEILPDNMHMQRICQRLGFTIQPARSPDAIHAVLLLDAASSAPRASSSPDTPPPPAVSPW